MGFYVGLSTNGTLIDAPMADRSPRRVSTTSASASTACEETHDRFRRKRARLRRVARRGAPAARARRQGRATLHDDRHERRRPARAAAADARRAGRQVLLSHLNYAGRGIHRGRDAHFAATRDALDRLFDAAWQDASPAATSIRDRQQRRRRVYLLQWARHACRAGPRAAGRLEAWGGNASGLHVANIDNLGHVHPDTMWWHHDLGSVRERPFSPSGPTPPIR